MDTFSTTDIDTCEDASNIAYKLKSQHNITFEDQMGLSDVTIHKHGDMVDYDDLSEPEQSLLNKLGEALEKEEMIKNAVEEAQNAFWDNITNSFPNITTGDLSLGMKIDLDDMMIKAVKEWVKNNS